MKGNITKSYNNNYKRRNYFVIAGIVILMLCIAITLVRKRDTNDNSYTPELPDIKLNGDVSYSGNTESTGMLLKATTGMVFQSDTNIQTVDIPNDGRNQYAFTMSIYLGDGTLLYESDYVYPDENITEISLSKQLDKGIYRNAVMVYKCYTVDDAHTVVSQCEFPIEIKCV